MDRRKLAGKILFGVGYQGNQATPGRSNKVVSHGTARGSGAHGVEFTYGDGCKSVYKHADGRVGGIHYGPGPRDEQTFDKVEGPKGRDQASAPPRRSGRGPPPRYGGRRPRHARRRRCPRGPLESPPTKGPLGARSTVEDMVDRIDNLAIQDATNRSRPDL